VTHSDPKPTRILLVEDEPSNAVILQRHLQAEGFAVEWRTDGIGLVEQVRRRAPDCILLDLGLPGKDGLSICQELRRFSLVPILIITALDQTQHKLAGLNSGADDYLCKPFDLDEVSARIRAVLRRSQPPPSPQVAPSAWHFDSNTLSVQHQDQSTQLTKVEFALLLTMANRPGRLFSRNELLDAVHQDQRVVSDRTIDTHIKNLRRKLTAALNAPDPIKAVYGTGYRFEERAG
jgi:two-component system, OmpR family, response regulator BaeR